MALGATGLATWQWNNNLKSWLLLAAFPLLLLFLVWLTFFLLGLWEGGLSRQGVPAWVFEEYGLHRGSGSAGNLAWVGMTGMAPTVFFVAALWCVIGYFFNGWLIARASGSRGVTRQEEPTLYNLVENLCISRGLRMPALRIIETDALNAFASGLNESNYTITVTRGLTDRLDRDELEAVLGHELTHIMNHDVRLLVVTMVFVGMISFVTEMVWRGLSRGSWRSRRSSDSNNSDSKGKSSLGALLVIAALVMLVGYAFSLLLRFALSRRREFLADAGAVELTKNPDAMIGALRKIEGHAAMPAVSASLSPMFIESPPPKWDVTSLFATHPTIPDRVAALEAYAGGRDDFVRRPPAPPAPAAPVEPPPFVPHNSPWARPPGTG